MDNGIVESKMMLTALKGLAQETLKDGSAEFVRRKKMRVVEGAHENTDGKNVITVQEAFGDAFDIPYAPSLFNVQPGDNVWVEWVYGFGNACAVNSGAWQASDLPTCVIPTADGLVMQVNFRPVMVISANGISMDAETVAVSGHIQGDVVNTSEGGSVTVNGKIQDAVDNLGKYLKGNVTINVPDGTYVEDVRVEGFTGNGELIFAFGDGVTVNGDWLVKGCGCVRFRGTDDGNGSVTTFVGVMDDAVVDVSGTGMFEIDTVEVHGVERDTGESGQDYGLRVRDGSYAAIKECLIDRAQIGVYVEHAHIDIIDCTGGAFSTDETTVANLTEGVVIGEDGGYVNAKGTIPAGPVSTGTGYDANGWPFTCSGTVSPVVSGGSAPPQVTEVTATWTSSGGYYCSSYRTGADAWQSRGTGWKGDGTANLRMGYNTSDQKQMAGVWVFSDYATIASTLNGKTITKATLSLTRSGANGATSGTVVKPYYTNLTPANIGNYAAQCNPWRIGTSLGDNYTDCQCAEQYIAFGQTGTFELPQAVWEKLQDGSAVGFGIGMNAETPFFQFVPGGCVLTVTYEE